MAYSEFNSPISLVSNATAETFVTWLESLGPKNRANVLLGFGEIEFRKIINLKHETVLRYFEQFVQKTSGEMIFTSKELVRLKPNPVYSSKELSSLNYDEKFKSKLEEKFFLKKDKMSDKAYDISHGLIKISLECGTKGSMNILKALIEAGSENKDLFLIKLIQ